MENESVLNIHGLNDRLTELKERLDPERNLSSAQFWLCYYQELMALEESDSPTKEALMQSLVNVLSSAGRAIEHLENRVVALEDAVSQGQADQS